MDGCPEIPSCVHLPAHASEPDVGRAASDSDALSGMALPMGGLGQGRAPDRTRLSLRRPLLDVEASNVKCLGHLNVSEPPR
jgi:hypothetical protein